MVERTLSLKNNAPATTANIRSINRAPGSGAFTQNTLVPSNNSDGSSAFQPWYRATIHPSWKYHSDAVDVGYLASMICPEGYKCRRPIA